MVYLPISKVIVPRSMARHMGDWARKSAIDPKERVIALVGQRGIDSVYIRDGFVVPNRHEEPENNFTFDSADLERVHRNELVGVLHTHPRGHKRGPSRADIQGMQDTPALIGAVIHIPSHRVTFYDAQGVIARTKWS